MKIKTLSAAVACLLPLSPAFAAALDRSGQSISAFLQSGNYAEVGISILDPSVSGKEAGTSETRNSVGDMAGDYSFANAAIKIQPTKQFSFGVIYDQPFGANASYSGDNIFVGSANDTILPIDTLNGLKAGRIATEVEKQLPLYLQPALDANLAPSVNAQVTAQAQQLLASGALPAGATLAMAEAAIRSNETAMQQITAGVTAAITDTVKAGVEAEVTKAVEAGIGAANGLLGKGATRVKVDTHALSLIGGFSPIENLTIYGGAVYQALKGEVNLRGQAYSLYSGYDLKINQTEEWGWLAGVAYQIPEIALKASLTYRSEIDYDLKGIEALPTLGALELLGAEFGAAAAQIANASGTTAVTTPQSVNLDFQTGIMADTVAFANVRWVDWSNFAIKPYKFGLVSDVVGKLPQIGRPNGFNLVEYDKDQWSVTAGVGRKLNDQWAGNVSVGWDSGAGNPVTTLGPTDGFWNVGLGVQYSPAANYFVAGGVKYFWLGDAKAQTGAQAGGNAYVADFEGNHAIAYGLKMGYRF